MATVSHKKNAISSLKEEHDNFITDHEGKAALLYTTFNNRMGDSNQPQMQFDLDALICPNVDLSSLIQPFTRKEIDLFIKRIPFDKAPRPDGFNGMFVKKCWQFIKDDFYSLCDFFYKLDVHFGVSTTPSSPWSRKLIPQIYE